ncbi:MAG: thiamine phosphate synthase [Planctomycetes bacterium]|nr:thiamine phosphate synthase [Planctomycetota bacterium]
MQQAVYRIIDANFNRAREAARVVEEFCRFVLNSPDLSARTKQLRHDISAAVQTLDSNLLVTSRDVQSDVGREMVIDRQMTRTTLDDCLHAATKRLSEALRALSEMTQTIDPQLAQTLEKLRFQAYTLEKDIVTAASSAAKLSGVRLYVIITVSPGYDRPKILELARACTTGGADCLQLRPKQIPDDESFQLACDLVGVCKDARALSIINDRADIAIAAGAGGVHLGHNDLPVRQVRNLAQRPLIIGVSTHAPDQLSAALKAGADYVALGPVFSTSTKPDTAPVGLDYVRQAAKILNQPPETPNQPSDKLGQSSVKSVAIGGITAENVTDVLQAGAQAVAVCSVVTQAKDPAAMCAKLKERIENFA